MEDAVEKIEAPMPGGSGPVHQPGTAAGDAAIVEGRVPDGEILIDRARLPQAAASLLDPRNPELHARAVQVGGRGAAWFVHTDAGPAVLRQYRRGGMAARVSRDRYLWQGAERTRGFHEFRLLRALRERGLPVPAPLAAAYWREGATYRAVLLTECISGARSLGERMDAGQVLPWASMGRTIAAFHRAGAFHADLNVDNMLMDTQARIWLIDFDRGALRTPSRGWQQANLARLRRSLRKRMGKSIESSPSGNGWAELLSAYAAAMKAGAMEPLA